MTLRDHVFERLDGTGADALVLAVSGGGDSTAMLVLAADWARSRGARLFAATIDHGLRAESAEEARFVAGLCEGLGVDHATIGWQAQAEGNLQQEARRARRRLLAEHARACGAQDVILGHTQDDVAETFLMRIERGSGLDGLSAIADRFEAHGVRFHRPLLSCSRSSLRELLTDRGIPWREDPTNADMRFLRSRIRSILPALDTVGLSVERLAETAHRLSDARAALDLHAAALARDTLAETPEGAITLDRALFLEAPSESRRRVLSGLLMRLGALDHPPPAEAIARWLHTIERGGGGLTLAGWRLSVGGKTAHLVREEGRVAPPVPYHPEGTLWDGRWHVSGPGPEGAMLGAAGASLVSQRFPDVRGIARLALVAAPALRCDGEPAVFPLDGRCGGASATLATVLPLTFSR